MAPQPTHSRATASATPDVETGAFPFQLTGRPQESPYLTWLRNRSNYMAPRGLLDYLQAAAVLVRGVLLNFLIFLPSLLLVAIGLAYAHHWMLAHPFRLTLGVLEFSVAWILVLPVATPIFNIASYRRSVETGSESSVTQRDLYERSFGVLLLAIVAVAALESLPPTLEYLHEVIQMRELGGRGGLATLAAAVAALSSAGKLLSVLGGVKQKLAMVLIGLLGLLVPLLVILYATDFLVYGLPPSPLVMYSPLVVPVAAVIGITIALPLGVWRRAFTRNEFLVVVGLLVVASALFVFVIAASYRERTQAAESLDRLDEEVINPLDDLVSGLEVLENTQETTPEVTALVGALIDAHHQSIRDQQGPLAELDDELAKMPEHETCNGASKQSSFDPGLFRKALRCFPYDAEKSQLDKRYFRAHLAFLTLGRRLSAQPPERLAPLRRELARRAHRKVLERIEAAEPLRWSLVEHYLSPSAWNDRESDSELQSKVGERFKSSVHDRDRRVAAIHEARAALQRRPVTEIADLIDEEALFQRVAVNFSDLPGRAKTARLAGKEELAKLLTSTEMLDLFQDQAEADAVSEAHREWFLEDAVPSFHERRRPDDPHSDVASGKLVEQTRGTARALAGLAALTPRSNGSPRDGRDESVPGENATPTEIARAAGVRLARRALHDLDLDHLSVLAFPRAGDSQEADPRQTLVRSETRSLQDLVTDVFPLEKEEPGRDAAPKVLLAGRALGNDTGELARLARGILIERALAPDFAADEREKILHGFALFPVTDLRKDELARIATANLWSEDSTAADDLITKVEFGPHGRLEEAGLKGFKAELTNILMPPKMIFVALLAVVIWLGCWLTVDVNLTSVHGLYRDRLAAAFLIGKDEKGDVAIGNDLALDDICLYDARSTAPYHLINAALNLQGTSDPGVRSRKSDFFVFSKRFVGGPRTGYCRSETLKQVFPQMSLSSAMAISAAAASPNMGRFTSPLLVAFMTLLNVRMGVWMPNPGLLEQRPHRPRWKPWRRNRQGAAKPGFTFEEVFAGELREIGRRWDQAYPDGSRRRRDEGHDYPAPTVEHGLVGIAFSGGGIRSAALNLGVTQALSQHGAFDHLDYMSTVSGGGYLGSSISTLMRCREALASAMAGTVAIRWAQPARGGSEKIVEVTSSGTGETRRYRFAGDATLNVRDGEEIPAGRPLLKARAARGQSETAGTVTVDCADQGERIVTVQGVKHRFSRFDSVVVETGETVEAGQDLIRRYDTLGERFRWRVRPTAFLREMLGKLDETHGWVNLSDGGHIENLATIELLRRRCKYILIGDGEADPNLHFGGLATLMRCAYLDLGIRIDIDLDAIRANGAHWAVGKITYPTKDGEGSPEIGYLLYLKSSFTGDEGEVIREYRDRDPTFPHQTTADQFFDEDQFEAYRALGQHIAEGALEAADRGSPAGKMSFRGFEDWFGRLRETHKRQDRA
jgi:hypothetical protein